MTKAKLIGKSNAFLPRHYSTYRLLELLVFGHRNNYFQYDLHFYQPNNPAYGSQTNTYGSQINTYSNQNATVGTANPIAQAFHPSRSKN